MYLQPIGPSFITRELKKVVETKMKELEPIAPEHQ